METPEKWGRDSIAILRRMFELDRWTPLSDEREEGLEDLRAALLDAVDRLGAQPPRGGDSPPLFLRQLSDELKRAEAAHPDVSAAPFYVRFLGAVERALDPSG